MPIAALDDQASISAAWRQAVRFLRDQKARQAYNLAYVVTEPHIRTIEDRMIFSAFDAFARTAKKKSITTVANTIFPLDCYRLGGSKGVFDRYELDVYPRVKKQWGNYFDRMTRRRTLGGEVLLDKDGEILNPLKLLIEKLALRVKSARGSTTHFELPLTDDAFDIATYNPQADYRYNTIGGPCLSHLSFKLAGRSVRLTAFYRSHTYLDRALGNLVGLARLQWFVAKEAGANVGPLIVIAADASLARNMGEASTAETAAFLDAIAI